MSSEDRSVDATDDDRRSPEATHQLGFSRPRHRSASPRDGTTDRASAGPGCPVRGRRLAPGEVQSVDGVRRRYNSMSGCTMTRPVIAKRTGDDASRRLRVSRDATQPATGSMRSLRSSSQDSEEADEFPERSVYAISGTSVPLCGRPRAATCPESKAFRRRARVRSFNRPPTPTPTPTGTDTDSPAANDADEDDGGSSQRLADLRLNIAYVRDPANGRAGIVVTKSPSLGNCGADLPAISESQ